MSQDYATAAPTRDEVDAMPGICVIEFGTSWCGHCQRAQVSIAAAFAPHSELKHIKVEDGPGRRLGRSFRVKLWPTLVFLRDGEEVARVVRPTDGMALSDALAAAGLG
ncbi:thioredoxin family protein [Lysobacter sp. H21R4]|uniref:thioredoxin family protein n=1 Tax=Lysobacter sp. H21R4 TaxID=2781021 RepID=UPI0018873FB9|nr:thioredoxin family protein [Lysobacter sp. H21R4]QOY63803.1 thioredoxin family protein [Lysobacter sp. H21R4]